MIDGVFTNDENDDCEKCFSEENLFTSSHCQFNNLIVSYLLVNNFCSN